jgi:tRNA 2-thiouridine synthesizing protein D
MPKAKTSFALMDPPYENARSTTALRLIDCALRRGHNVNVFAYEGAVGLAFAKQAPHPNAKILGLLEIPRLDPPARRR